MESRSPVSRTFVNNNGSNSWRPQMVDIRRRLAHVVVNIR